MGKKILTIKTKLRTNRWIIITLSETVDLSLAKISNILNYTKLILLNIVVAYYRYSRMETNETLLVRTTKICV